jgi:hypothetical protein
LRFAESFRVHQPISTSQFAAVAALPSRNNSLRYTLLAARSRAFLAGRPYRAVMRILALLLALFALLLFREGLKLLAVI